MGRGPGHQPGAIPRFLARFEETYSRLGRTDAILAAATAHHRLLWIHPFLDGNGRVARLMSHAMLLESLDTGGLWSVARGLARNVAEYKRRLASCELPRADVSSALGTTARHARRIVSALANRGVLVSEGPRAPWRLAFPAARASRWMPGLFPDRE